MNKQESLTFLQSCIEKVKNATEQDIQFYKEVIVKNAFRQRKLLSLSLFFLLMILNTNMNLN